MAYQSRAKRLQEVLDNFEQTIQTAKEEAQSGVEELKDEITDWREGMEGTNLENTDKYSQLEDCESELEDLDSEIENLDAEINVDVSFPGMY